MTITLADIEAHPSIWSGLPEDEREQLKAEAKWAASLRFRFYYDYRARGGDFHTSHTWGLDAADAERRARATMQWLDRFYDLDPRWDAVILPGETACITRDEYERRQAAARVPMAGLFEEIRKAAE